MSEILITGLEMLPEGFAYDVRIRGNGDVVDRQTRVVMGKAIGLPPHGRLGDLDKLADVVDSSLTDYDRMIGTFDNIQDMIEEAPTIIEASTEGEAST